GAPGREGGRAGRAVPPAGPGQRHGPGWYDGTRAGRTGGWVVRGPLQHPARLLPVAFLAAIGVSTLLLLLPAARADPDGTTPLVVALFTAVSAVCVTGLTVVDTSFWSDVGHAVIVVSAHVGGYGIMTAATLLGLLVARRLGVRTRLLATAEGRTLNMANIRGVLLRVALIQLGFEVAVAVPITLRWWWSYGQSLPEALRNGRSEEHTSELQSR